MDKKTRIIDTVDAGGKPLKLEIRTPNHKILQNATMAYNMKVSSLIRNGSETGERLLLRAEIEDHLIKAGIWSQADSAKLQTLSISIRAAELMLQRGGIKLIEAKKIALDMSKNRMEIMSLVGKRQQLDSATVESVAENYKFAHFALNCIRRVEDRQLFFSEYDDYVNRGGEDASIASCKALAEMVYGVAEDIQNNLFETRWLKKAGFVNDDGRFINSDGHLVDEDGRLIDEEGRFVNENKELVDLHGVRIEDNGDFCCIDPKPFIDEEGKEVEILIGIKLDTSTNKATKKSKTTKSKKRKRKIKV